jgi:hypothetical protein
MIDVRRVAEMVSELDGGKDGRSVLVMCAPDRKLPLFNQLAAACEAIRPAQAMVGQLKIRTSNFGIIRVASDPAEVRGLKFDATMTD